jgi:hypothetical protein
MYFQKQSGSEPESGIKVKAGSESESVINNFGSTTLPPPPPPGEKISANFIYGEKIYKGRR